MTGAAPKIRPAGPASHAFLSAGALVLHDTLFAPWSALLLPIIGAWSVVFLAQFLIYTRLDASFHIEGFYKIGGN